MILGSDFFIANREKLREAFSGTAPIVLSGNFLMQKSADTAFEFAQDSNFWYLAGLNEPGLILVIDGDKEYIILPKNDKTREVFDGLFDTEHAKQISGIDTFYDQKEGWKQVSKKIQKVKHVATVQPFTAFVESMSMFTSPAKAKLVEKIKIINPEIDFIDLRKILVNLRSIKTTEEINLVKQAIAETARLYTALEKKRKTAGNEKELMAEAQKFMTTNDLDFAYAPIIAGGDNANTLHYVKNNQKLDPSSPLLVDVAAKFGNYCSDITRTVCIQPTKRQKEVFAAVLDVQNYAFSLLKPGVILKEYEEKTLEFMGEKLRELGLVKTIETPNVREFYPHSTSHFLGIDPHDAGDYEQPLQEGMILTVEPGIYIKAEQIGIRIEDDVLITTDGCEILSNKIPKDITKLA